MLLVGMGAATLLAGLCVAAGDRGQSLRIILPDYIDPAQVQVHYTTGTFMGELGGRERLKYRDFEIVPQRGFRPIGDASPEFESPRKVYMYCPGYNIMWIEEPNLSVPWKPEFVKATTAILKGTLTDPNGGPAGGKEVRFTRMMGEDGNFYGYSDGPVSKLVIATAAVGSDGCFEAVLPVFEDDPFIQRYGDRRRLPDGKLGPLEPRGAQVTLTELVPMYGRYQGPLMVWPDSIELQREYDKPLALRVIRRPRISGRIGEAFRKANGITGIPSMSAEAKGGELRVTLDAEIPGKPGRSYMTYGNRVIERSHNCELKPDWTFSVLLEPGTYDIVLREHGPGYSLNKEIVVKEGMVVGDGSDVKVDVE